MEKLCIFLVLAIVSSQALGMNLRQRRQTSDTEEDLEDRYGWNRPNRPFIRPGQGWQQYPFYPNQPNQGGIFYPSPQQFPGGQFPGQGGQFPGQGGQFPGQGGQFPGQGGQFPGQGGQFPNQGGQFPGQGGQFPGQDGQFPIPNERTTPSPDGAGSTTTLSSTQNLVQQDCIRNCPVTAEYNPVCGTNNQTYDNQGRLECAQRCGVNVNLLRQSRCPAATTAPTS